MEDEQVSNHGSQEGLKSATLYELKLKVTQELEQKQSQLETEVLKKHRVSAERFQYSIEYYTTGITDVLIQNGVGECEPDEQISKDIQLLLNEGDKLTSRGK